MSTTAIVRSLYHFGLRLSPQAFRTITGYFRLELSSDPPLLSFVAEGIQVPSERDHSNAPNPWFGYDRPKFTLGINEERTTAFFTRLKEDLTTAGLDIPRRSIDRVLAYLLTHCESTDSAKGFIVTGLHADPSAYRNKQVLFVSQSDFIVPTWEGRSFFEWPAFRAIFEAAFQAAYTDELTGRETHPDLVTGRPCVPARKHPAVKGIPGTGGAAPLISSAHDAFVYWAPSFTDSRYISLTPQEDGDNFPVSENTARLYTQGLSTALKAVVPNGSDNLGLSFWPEEGTTHPLIPLAVRFFSEILNKEDADQLMTDIAALGTPCGSPDASLNVLLTIGSKGRICVVNWGQVRAGDLLARILALHATFRRPFPNFTFPLLRIRSNPEEKRSPIDQGMDSLVWAVVMGSPYPPRILSDLYQVLGKRPALKTEAERERYVWKNAATVAIWRKLMIKPETETETMTAEIVLPDGAQNGLVKAIPWPHAPLYNPRNYGISMDETDLATIYGWVVGIYLYLPVFYHGDRTKKGVVPNIAHDRPIDWVGRHLTSAHFYERHFASKKELARALIVYTVMRRLMTAFHGRDFLNRSLSNHNRGKMEVGVAMVEEWAEEFFFHTAKANVPAKADVPVTAEAAE